MRLLTLLTLILTLVLPLGLFAQDAFIAQDFEDTSTDEWNYTPQPEEVQRLILWGRMNQPVGSTIAQSGDWYWATWDLDNTEHSLVFDSVALPFGEVYTLHFHYYSVNLNPATDFVKYSIEYDDGTEWNNWITLEPNAGTWTQVSIDIPATESQVRLKVSAQYDGFSKYVHWDNFLINSQPAPLTAPVVSNLTVNQRNDGSKLVDITYDLFDANNDLCDISLQVSTDGGNSYSFTADSANLSGDVGEGVASGLNKEIIWDAGNESQAFSADNYFVQINAEDNTYLQIATPLITPETGTYDETQTITITCQTPDVEIYYTLDGSEPTEASTLYTAPFTLSTNSTVKARAYKVDWEESEIASAEYIINTDFVLVEGGTFNNETANVTISSFYMGKYEVTQAEYQAVMNTNPSCFSSSDKPVEKVTWYNAVAYCNARSIEEGLTPCYNTSDWSCDITANGYRLPTEMEWMFAAKGGNEEPASGYNQYAGTNIEGDLTNYAWYSSNSNSTTHNVGTKLPNQLGLYDMSGNVWEWCNDWCGDYSSSPQTNPAGPTSGSYRVHRGGSWVTSATCCRVAYRSNYGSPSGSYSDMGFRVARSSN